jgi:hypothetical protein
VVKRALGEQEEKEEEEEGEKEEEEEDSEEERVEDGEGCEEKTWNAALHGDCMRVWMRVFVDEFTAPGAIGRRAILLFAVI